MIEAAWLEVPDPNSLPTERFLQRYNPQKPIAQGAVVTHPILDEELVDCPPYTNFALLGEVQYIVGHHVDYDWKVIGEPPVKRICVLALSRSLFSELDSHSQSAMLYHLRRDIARNLLKNAHSASRTLETVGSSSNSFYASSSQTPTSRGDRSGLASERARTIKVMTFGKHKGAAIRDISGDYKSWLLKQPNVR